MGADVEVEFLTELHVCEVHIVGVGEFDMIDEGLLNGHAFPFPSQMVRSSVSSINYH